MNSYFVFTDEAGAYKGSDATSRFRQAHPFYIRSFVLMKSEEYQVYQKDMQILNAMYEIPIDEEIKWSDLWALKKRNPRTVAISKMSESRLMGYYRKVFERAVQCKSLQFLFTVTCVYDKSCLITPKSVFKFHLQNAFQRVSMKIDKNDFAVFIMDELNKGTLEQIKAICHELTVKGDFLEYNNLYHGVLTENSVYCPGIQLADYAAGAFNSYLREELLKRGRYDFSNDIFTKYISPCIRSSPNGSRLGFGIMDVPTRPDVKAKLIDIFDKE